MHQSYELNIGNFCSFLSTEYTWHKLNHLCNGVYFHYFYDDILNMCEIYTYIYIHMKHDMGSVHEFSQY